MRRRDVAAAELGKLASLPAVAATALGTVGAAIALTAAVAASSTAPTSAAQVTLVTIPYLQIGPLLIGILAVATEYTGHQIRTSLTATPDRLLLLAGKTVAYLTAAGITSTAAVGTGFVTAAVTLAVRDVAPSADGNAWPLAGAGAYLVLIGLLGFALTVLLCALIPPLVAMLALVQIISPLLSGSTEHARWLPDRAGGLLFRDGADAVLTSGTGALVLLGWIAATSAAAGTAFVARDA